MKKDRLTAGDCAPVGVEHHIHGEKDSKNMTREMVKGNGMMEKRKPSDGDNLNSER